MFLYRYDVIYHEVWILQAKLELCPWMSGTESYKLYFNYEVHSFSILLDLLRHVKLMKHGWAPGDSWTWVPNPTLSTGLKVILSNHCKPPGQVHLTENLTRSSQPLFTQKTNSEFNRNQLVSCMAQETDKDLEDPEDAKSQERNHRVVCGRPLLTALGAKKRQWKKKGIPEQSSSKVNMSQVSFSNMSDRGSSLHTFHSVSCRWTERWDIKNTSWKRSWPHGRYLFWNNAQLLAEPRESQP